MSAAFGWPQLVMYVNVGQAIVLVPTIVYATSRYGAIGAATTWVIMHSTYLFVMLPILFHRYLRTEKWKWFLFDLGRPLIGVALAGIFALWLLPAQSSPTRMVFYLGLSFAFMIAVSIPLAPTVMFWLKNTILKIK
jgi:hypothetical protein